MIVVGISTEKELPFNKQLGLTKKSYGYKADGKIFNNKTTGEEYGPKFEKGDVIGCGLIMPRKSIFFTCNGRFLGTAFSNIDIQKDSVYAALSLQTINEEVFVNFGTENFVFDIEGFKLDIA